MKSKIILALVFIALLTLGGIYGQLLTVFWTFIINIVSSYWIPILIICAISWLAKDKIEARKQKKL